MGRKLGLTSLFTRTNDRPRSVSSSLHLSPWPSCKHPRTHSFRAKDAQDCATSSVGESESFSEAASEDSICMEVAEEAVLRGASSDRLLFEPGDRTRSILEEAKTTAVPFDGCVAVVLESEDPRRDFRVSMEEMLVDGGGCWDIGRLEEMLGWFLTANGKKLHGIIVGAFLDLLAGLASSSSSSSPSSCTSFSSTSSSAFEIEEMKEEETNG